MTSNATLFDTVARLRCLLPMNMEKRAVTHLKKGA